MSSAESTFVQIRPARPQDIDAVRDFARELLLNWAAPFEAPAVRKVYQRVLEQPDLGIILVAENDGGIRGFAYAAYQWRAEYGGETMDLVEMFVEHGSRNRGVGRALLEALIAHARNRGIRRIGSQVHPGNAAIERALESGGFDPERRTVWGRLL